MKPDELARLMDNTILRPDATRSEVEAFVHASAGFPFASVFVPPVYVEMAAELLKGTETAAGTVAGFPLGYQAPGVKAFEARRAVEGGAAEVDMVINVTALKSGEDAPIAYEIREVVEAVPGAVVKVIIEAAYLNEEELKRAVALVIEAGAQFVKTSTGFGPSGAKVEDVRVLSDAASGLIGVKASGGIRTLEDALSMIEAGAGRIGTSAGIAILRECGKG